MFTCYPEDKKARIAEWKDGKVIKEYN